MSCFSHFLARGLPVAAGWRSWEQLKASGISPDGMVFLERSPYGPTWAYFEYERTARGEARVGRKLTGYGSDDRGYGWPALFVCWNDDAESVFQDLGSGMGIPLLTTTIKRLEEHGPLGNFGCWSVYGQPSHRPGSACFMAPATMRASWRYSGVNANLILRIWEDTLPGPRPEESVRSAISPGFSAVPVTLSPERRRKGAWKGLYAHSGGR